jgi:hypothetical protein
MHASKERSKPSLDHHNAPPLRSQILPSSESATSSLQPQQRSLTPMKACPGEEPSHRWLQAQNCSLSPADVANCPTLHAPHMPLKAARRFHETAEPQPRDEAPHRLLSG